MKINNIPGEFGYKALISDDYGWRLTDNYFFSYEEVRNWYKLVDIKWPIELDSSGVVYVPAEEEL